MILMPTFQAKTSNRFSIGLWSSEHGQVNMLMNPNINVVVLKLVCLYFVSNRWEDCLFWTFSWHQSIWGSKITGIFFLYLAALRWILMEVIGAFVSNPKAAQNITLPSPWIEWEYTRPLYANYAKSMHVHWAHSNWILSDHSKSSFHVMCSFSQFNSFCYCKIWNFSWPWEF